MGDLISREYVEKLVEELENICQNAPEYVLELLSKIKNAPTVEPKLSDEQINKIVDLLETEWGYEGIREDVTRILKQENTVEPKPQGEWTPIVTRPLTEEEKEEYPDYTCIYECPMPDDCEEVLVSTKWGVSIDTYYAEPDGCYFENYCDEGDVLAWQPFPKPYEGGKDK